MDCPVCSDPMVVLELDRIEVDYCLTCGGVWLDAGELELLLEGAENRGRLLRSFEMDLGTTEEKIRCPICSKKMAKTLCGTKRVRIDSCTANDGLWFDKGELLEIVEMGDFPGDHRMIDLLKDIFGRKD